MALVLRIFTQRDCSFDFPLAPGITLPTQMATFRTDGFAQGEGWYVPYHEISMALVYEDGRSATVFSIVPNPDKPA